MNCSECNSPLNPDVSFCTVCGHDNQKIDVENTYNHRGVSSHKIKFKAIGLAFFSILIVGFLLVPIRTFIFEAPHRAVSNLYKAVEEGNLDKFIELNSKTDSVFIQASKEDLNELIIQMDEYYTDEYGEGWSENLFYGTQDKSSNSANIAVKIEKKDNSGVEPDVNAFPARNIQIIGELKVTKEKGKWLIMLSHL
ncbi:MAG TPA: hypothetical protein GX707_16355 [Epulopiscium sp.]|nr:hypothetical protein [Candidatus Epulonipiscium sp.]